MNRAWAVLLGLAVGPAGCVGPKAEKAQTRSQAGEDPADPDLNATVASKTDVDNMGPVHVSGVGLVYGLEPGAGSHPPQGGWRAMLEASFKKAGFTNIREIIDHPEKRTSLVLVSAVIPAGARKDEPVDLQITLPDDSKTQSLKGGVLYACELTEYDTTGNLRSVAKGGRPAGPSGGLVLGNVWVKTVEKAAVVAGIEVGPDGKAVGGADGDRPSLRVGRVWAGGRVVRARPYYFLMKPGEAGVRTTAQVAERLNTAFGAGTDPSTKVAEVSLQGQKLVTVNVPYPYRNNHPRFLVVARQVPMAPAGPDSPYRRDLEDQLLDPATAVRAAVKLEALGGDARRALKVGLESPSPWVRFASAEALAYLGHSDGAGELARLAEDHPAIRAQCLLALAAADDAAFTDKLVELMASPDPQLRYGAFVALRLADDRHPALGGRQLAHALWVHRVAPGSAGMVHLATDRRSEMVVFGDNVRLKGPIPPFTLGPDLTVSMPAGAAEVVLTRIVKVKGEWDEQKQTCPPDLSAVLAAIAKLGGGHPEAVALIRGAAAADALTAAVAVDALPRQLSIQQLALIAPKDPALVKANAEVARAGRTSTDPETAGVDLADPEAEPKPGADAAPRAPLSREPGRIFGPKRPPEPAGEPLSPVVPAAGTAPAEAPPADRGRNPGTLFPRK